MKTITPLEASKLLVIDAASVLVDVRQESEWINGYPNLDYAFKKPILLTITSDLDSFANILKDNIENLYTPILFLCHSGQRSSIATSVAENMGYSNCYNVAGGFSEWKKLSLPIQNWS